MAKRNRNVMIRLTDAEHDVLEQLEASYSVFGLRATKSFLFRYGLKRLPPLPASPFPA